MTDIGAVLLTYNCRSDLKEVLENLSWCDEQVVVDSQSDDGTREIAREADATIVDVPQVAPGEPFDHFRQQGVEAIDTDWIVTVDVDERIPPQLARTLQDHTEDRNPEAIVEAPRANYLGRRLLCGTRQWPDYEAVLFRKGSAVFRQTAHSFFETKTDSIRRLPPKLQYATHHHFAESVWDHFTAQRRYAKIAARREFRFRHLLAPVYYFVDDFVRRGGYREGLVGLGLSLCWAWFQAEATARSAIASLRRD